MIAWLMEKLRGVDNEVQYALESAQHKREVYGQLAELDLGFTPSISCVYKNSFDIDNPTRENVLELLRKMGGKWDKTPGYNGKMNYERREPWNGRRVVLCAAQPPPSCKIIEEEVEIPAQPARKELRKRLICTETESAESETDNG